MELDGRSIVKKCFRNGVAVKYPNLREFYMTTVRSSLL